MEATTERPELSSEDVARLQAWGAQNSELVSDVAKTAQKPEEERTRDEENRLDMYAEEIRSIVPGGGALTTQQLLELSINLDLMNTRHAGTQIRSLNDAQSYVGSEFQQGAHHPDEHAVTPGPNAATTVAPSKSTERDGPG